MVCGFYNKEKTCSKAQSLQEALTQLESPHAAVETGSDNIGQAMQTMERYGLNLIILGIDPGYATLGIGVIEKVGYNYRPIEYGAVVTPSDMEFSRRLEIIYDKLIEIGEKHKPQYAAIEKIYFQNNQKTAINVSQARGVILLAMRKNNIKVVEYTPLQVKSSVTGYGKADKRQIMEMTKRLLGLKEVPKPDDTADALAVAICHGQCLKTNFIRK